MSTSARSAAPPATARAQGRVLVVDDHAPARESMAFILRCAGHQTLEAASAQEALTRLASESVDVILTDLRMPGMTGLQFMQQLAGIQHGAQVVMVTAYASVATAVEAMRHGAFDYLEKPCSAEQLEAVVHRALAHGDLLDARSPAAPSAPLAEGLIGDSRPMQQLRAQIACVAATSETVLITGESGTGKELVARQIHALSPRASRPLVSVNCPVLAAQLTESELFGHERGAFTGADAPRTGRFELADGGTIHLDEITEISLPLQAKLLRVLQEKTIERVGSSTTQHVDVRVLASSNRNLKEEIRAGRFREDLYYRLAVVVLHVPPLRERREDVPDLARHLLARVAARLRREPCELDRGAEAMLIGYRWPGNVRELENVITRSSVFAKGRSLSADDLRGSLLESPDASQGALPDGSPSVETAESDLPVGLKLADMERRLIEATLEQFGGHRAKTAEALGIGLRTLTGKIKAYGHAPKSHKQAA